MGRPRELSSEERAALLAQGFRPLEVWVPDWDNPAFRARLAEEGRRIAAAEAGEEDLDGWIEQARGNAWDDELR